MKSRELFEELLEHELLSEGVGVQFREGNVVEGRSLTSENVVISNVAKVALFLCDEDSSLSHIFSAFHLTVLLFHGHSLEVVFGEGVESNAPVTLHDEVDLSNVSLFFKQVAVRFLVQEFTGHEAERDLVCEVRVELLS